MQEWISVKDRLPEDFVSVIGCMTDSGDFPSVRECYLIGGNNERFYFPALGEFHPISHWMEFPKEPKNCYHNWIIEVRKSDYIDEQGNEYCVVYQHCCECETTDIRMQQLKT